jgi:hypothetical protein
VKQPVLYAEGTVRSSTSVTVVIGTTCQEDSLLPMTSLSCTYPYYGGNLITVIGHAGKRTSSDVSKVTICDSFSPVDVLKLWGT